MGGCSVSSIDDQANALLCNKSNETSFTKQQKSRRDKPKCECGKDLNLYELQCCFSSENEGTAEVICKMCAKRMCDPFEMVWHCVCNRFSYNLCQKCGIGQNEEMKQNDDAFDAQYNTNSVDWNMLHQIISDSAQYFAVNEILKSNFKMDELSLSKYGFSPDIMQFIQSNLSICENARSVHAACNDQSGWTIQSEAEGICISYKKEKAASYYSIKADFVANADILDFIGTLNEFDLLGELVKFVKVETRMLGEFNDQHKVIYFKTALFWPFKDMDFVLHVNGCNALNEFNEVIIWGSSPKAEDDQINGIRIPSVKECNSMRIEIVRLDAVCKPMGENRCRVIIIYNVDFKIALPQKVINWLLKTLSFTLVKVLKERCQNLQGTETEKRMNSKKVYTRWRMGCRKAEREKQKELDLVEL